MDFNFSVRHHRKSPPSSDRFLGVFSPPSDSLIVDSSGYVSGGDELDEDDVFWTGDFAQNKTTRSTAASSFNDRVFVSGSSFGKRKEKLGILAALSDESKFQPSAARNVLTIPKPPSGEREVPSTTPKFNFSAPVKVPVLSKEMMKSNGRRNRAFFDVQDDDDGEGGDDEMLPPHEIVARGSALTPNTTFSMLEGAGRTLKGRDLRQCNRHIFSLHCF